MDSGRLRWFAFYPQDWISEPKLFGTNLVTRGIWHELLCVMFIQGNTSVTGDVTHLAFLARANPDELEQFLNAARDLGFADVTESNGVFTIASRRFAREEKDRAVVREQTRERVRRFREKRTGNGKKRRRNAVKQNVTGAVTGGTISNSLSNSILWPSDLILSETMKKYATDRSIDAAAEFAAWHDDCLAHGRKYRDWEAAWRTRINNAPRFASKNGQPAIETPKRKENYMDKIDRW